MLYSINGGSAFQSNNFFQGLGPGNYAVRVNNSVTGCFTNYSSNPVTLVAPNCFEICDNDIDDDGDGLIDCNDPDCGPANLAWLNPPGNICLGSPVVLKLTGARIGFSFELFQDGASTSDVVNGTGDTITFHPLIINDATTFYVVAKSLSDPSCQINFVANGISVSIGSLEIEIDTSREDAVGNNGEITVCLPSGVPPYTLEYSPIRGMVDVSEQKPGCSGYFKITGLKAGYYKIMVTDAIGCSNTQTALVNNPEKRRVGFPEKPLLTPNGDGVNDVLVYDGLFRFPDESELLIYDRYGSILYRAKPYENNWDATYNGEPLPAGTYFYTLRVVDEDETIYSGFITVLR